MVAPSVIFTLVCYGADIEAGTSGLAAGRAGQVTAPNAASMTDSDRTSGR
jgi:hypothetical protein